MMVNLLSGLADKYLVVLQDSINIISVFDALQYDRSDADLMTPNMRTYVVNKLKSIGFKQQSGNRFTSEDSKINCHFAKPRLLVSSSFDCILTQRSEADYHILTPTQTACQLFNTLPLEQAIEAVSSLIKQQPINVYKIKDYSYNQTRHKEIISYISYLTQQQQLALSNPKLAQMRSL